MFVRDLMSKNIISLSSNDTAQKLISLMEKNHVHEVLVIDNDKLTGMISTKILTQRSIADPSKTKIKSLLTAQIAMLTPDQDLDTAASIILKTGFRAMPVVDRKKVVGVLSLHDIVNEFSKTKLFRQTKAPIIMSEAITVTDQDDIGKARVLMREHNISRLAVVDSEGKLNGILTVFDLMKAVKPKERIGFYSMAAEMDRIMQLPVSTVMKKQIVTVGLDSSLTDVAALMDRYETSGVVVASGGYPKGVIVLKDLLEFYVSGLEKQGVYYQIIGLGDEDDFVLETVDRMIQNTIQKLSSIHKINFMFIHVKRHDVGIKNRIKYSVRVRLRTDKGMFISKAWSWDLRSSTDQALDSLERAVMKNKEIGREKFRKNVQRIKKLTRS